MLETCFGKIEIVIDGTPYFGTPITLPLSRKQFQVDSRFKIVVKEIPHSPFPVTLEISLIGDETHNLVRKIESGERLAAVSFLKGTTKLSIGTEGDIKNIKYIYTENGMRLVLSSPRAIEQISFIIAWKKMKNANLEYNDTWFAVDPEL